MLQLYRGHTPGRPESRAMEDAHWNFIQSCWSPLQERPAADAIVLAMQRFLSDYPPSVPLCDLFISPPSQDDSNTSHKPTSEDLDSSLQVSGSHPQVPSESPPHSIPILAGSPVPENKSLFITQSLPYKKPASFRQQLNNYFQSAHEDDPHRRLVWETLPEGSDDRPNWQAVAYCTCNLLITLSATDDS